MDDETVLTNKRQKLEEKAAAMVKVAENNDVLSGNNYFKDDTVAIMMSFLKIREMGMASFVSKQWRKAFDSDIVQTEEIKADIRWVKYSCGQLSPKRIVVDTQCEHLRVLSDGYWLSSHGNKYLEEEISDSYKLRIYSSRGDIVHILEVDGYFSSACVSKNSDVVVTSCHDYSYWRDGIDDYVDPDDKPINLQLWRKGSTSAFEKGPCLESLDTRIRRMVVSRDEKIYCRTYSFIKTWNPNEKGSGLTILASNVCSKSSSLLLWKDLLVFGGADGAIEIWSTMDNQHIKTIQSPKERNRTNIILDITVKEVSSTVKHILLSSYQDGSVRIFSFEDGCFLQRMATGPINNDFRWFRMTVCPDTCHVALAKWGENRSSLEIEIWKIHINNRCDKADSVLLGTIDYRNALNLWTVEEAGFLPHGRLLTMGPIYNTDNFCIHLW